MATLAAHLDRPSAPAEQPHGLGLTYHRLMLVMLLFVGVTLVIVGRLAMLQLFTDRASAAQLANPLLPPRGDIVDRNGVPLASTIQAWAIGARPREIIGDRRDLAQRLHQLIPERSADQYYALLGDRRSFVYLARPVSPELVTAVNGLGEPGIVFSREPERLYPQTALAGHVIGWTDTGGRGIGGMEKALQDRLMDPAQRGNPVALSIDSRVQAVMESELANAVTSMSAEGGTGIVLDVRTGEVVAMASAPTFNPNDAGRYGRDALLNRATVSVYELGSTFKPITVAAAMEAGVITSMRQRFDASAPIPIGRFQIHDDHPMGRALTVPELMVYSSNIATARVADAMGAARMQAAFRTLGFNTLVPIELGERGRTLWPRDWGRSTVMTSGFGHGIAVTPLHLAIAYAALVNGGIYRPATLMRVAPGQAVPGRRIYSEATSYRIRQLLRLVVMQGTGRNANAPGFRVGGKTGTAEKVSNAGGYNRSVNVSTFAGVFPMDAPRYVVLVMIDAPRGTAANSGVTTAAWTAAPVVARVIARTGPLLGIIPDLNRDIPTAGLMPPVAAAAAGH
ncbi:MAG TPA: penicillin-binding protein 2 [Allosphingosinicella sp.]|jgi:cell division protein FtsI (penicillin-binding protein 3)|nr:penicillin-binding protein 2 [Allosphingosinicella sp.]